MSELGFFRHKEQSPHVTYSKKRFIVRDAGRRGSEATSGAFPCGSLCMPAMFYFSDQLLLPLLDLSVPSLRVLPAHPPTLLYGQDRAARLRFMAPLQEQKARGVFPSSLVQESEARTPPWRW